MSYSFCGVINENVGMNHATLELKTLGLRHVLNHRSLIYCHLLAESVRNADSLALFLREGCTLYLLQATKLNIGISHSSAGAQDPARESHTLLSFL